MFSIIVGIWVALTVVRVTLPLEHGLRGRYFMSPTLDGQPVSTVIDPEISSAQVYARWHAMPPDAFGVRWSGFVHVPQSGSYTFTLTSDGTARLTVDGRQVVETKATRGAERMRDRDGMPIAIDESGTMSLDRGPHRVLLDVGHQQGLFTFEWSWARESGVLTPVPPWRLSVSASSRSADLMTWVHRIWWVMAAVVVAVACARILPLAVSWLWRHAGRRRMATAVLLLAAAVFYVTAAMEHARVVNTSKASGDQSGYLYDAREVYANAHGRTSSRLIGFRMRMPAYAGLLSLFYDPGKREWEFFEVAKAVNIGLSVLLLAVLAILFTRFLPLLPAVNLTLVVAFGYFVFKAGYCQPELLFYFFFFVTFLFCCCMFGELTPLVMAWHGIAAGTFAGFAYLTKALVPPFVLLFLAVFIGREIVRLAWGHRHDAPSWTIRRFATRTAAGLLMAVSFLAVASPYILNNKREFGEYFFNQNTAFYMWFDNGIDARAVMIPLIDLEGRLKEPRDLPGMRTYVGTHTVAQIGRRIVDGLIDVAARLRQGYAYQKYLIMYLAFAILLMGTHRTAFLRLAHRHAALLLFLLLYGAMYLVSTAFFVPTSQTGGIRFILAHLAPLLFVLSCLIAHASFRDTQWTVFGVHVTPAHFHVLVSTTLGFDVTFLLWHRLMTTYGGS